MRGVARFCRVGLLLVVFGVFLVFGTGGASALDPPPVTFMPVADSYVDAAAPSTKFGLDTALRVDGSPVKTTYLRFDLTGLTGTVTGATLRVWADTAQSVGYDVYATSNTWAENAVTFNDGPAPTTGVIGSSGRVTAYTWTSVDVTTLVSGNGLISLALTTTSTNALRMQSRENTHPPELVVTTAGGNTAPTADAGADETVASEAAGVGLDGSGSSDFQGDPLTYSWTQTSGPAVVQSGAGTATPSFDAPAGPATLTFELEVCDPEPLCATDTVEVTVEAPVIVAPVTFQPVADSYVDAAAPSTKFGLDTALRVDGSPVKTTYLRFDLTGLTGTVTGATLRVWADTAQSVGYDVHYVVAGNTWDEQRVTFANKPAIGTSIGSSGPVNAGGWASVDLTSLPAGGGQVSFALTTTSANALRMQSRENTHPPELVVTATATDGSCIDNSTRGGSYTSLQAANDAATAGDTLTISGTCPGGATITKNLTIEGNSSGTPTLQGGGATIPGSVVTIQAGVTVSISGVTISGGQNGQGGGINNNGGLLTLTDVIVTNNTATGGLNRGGGIFSGGTLTLSDTTITGNTATNGGGGIWNSGSTVTLNDSNTISGNTATYGGGGIGNSFGTVTLNDNSTITGNTAAHGGGISNFVGTVDLNDDGTITGNTATSSFGGGGIYNDDGTVTLSNSSTITGNTAANGAGGGIFNSRGKVTMNDSSTITGNTATNGGGIFNEVATTIAASSDGQSLPQSTISVASTSGFAPHGHLNVVSSAGRRMVSYTGITPSSFTGASGGIGVLSTGGLVVVAGAVVLNNSTIAGNTPNACINVIGC